MSANEAVRRLQSGGVTRLLATGSIFAEAIHDTPSDTPTRKPRDLEVYPRGTFLMEITRHLLESHANREVSRKTGAHKDTVAKVRKLLESFIGVEIPCACGRVATHRGWCPVRYQQSTKRQA